MAIDHSSHDHPATPAARAACRKAMGAPQADGNGAPATSTPVRRTKARAVSSGTSVRPSRRTVRVLRDEGDLAGVPAALAPCIRVAWHLNLAARFGPSDRTEGASELIIGGPKAVVTFVWTPGGDRTPEGRIAATFARPVNSSVTRRLNLTSCDAVKVAVDGIDFGCVAG